MDALAHVFDEPITEPTRQDLWVWLDQEARSIELRPGFDIFSALDLAVLNARRDGELELGCAAATLQILHRRGLTDRALRALMQLVSNHEPSGEPPCQPTC